MKNWALLGIFVVAFVVGCAPSAEELRTQAERLVRGDYDVPALKANALARAAAHTYHARAHSILGFIDSLR